ncbi:MAG: HNH endonuclease [Caldilineaceae bacterium]|nr:HNH endonuclease [Caldilineaceae bacterium]
MQTQYTTKDLARFYSKIQVMPNGCHEWIGTVVDTGYGHMSFGARKQVLAHRMAWEVANGPIPAGACILHRCDCRRCVNPDHLFLGSNKDNSHDAMDKGRLPFGTKIGTAKLTDDAVKEIRALSASGMGLVAIGERFGVGKTTIWRVVHREHWKHVE